MSHELMMDESKEIFSLDKEILLFKIDQLSLNKLSSQLSSNNNNHIQALSEQDINITNLTSEYIAFRTKTTKKGNYSVNPIYCIIPPNSTQSLNIIFYDKPGVKLNSKGHKFKFEGFIIPESQKNQELKDLFNEYIRKGIKVKGNVQKRIVQFSDKNEDSNILRSTNNNLTNSNLSSFNSYYSIADNIKDNIKDNTLLMEKIKEKEESNNIKFSDIILDKKNENYETEKNRGKFENLKREYNQLKEQIDNLKINQELLNKRIYNEKNKKNNLNGSSIKFNYKVPEDKEKNVSMNLLIGLFLLSSLIGFYLIK